MTENNIKSSIEIITPKMAQEYLDSQIQNRKWRRDIVNKYKNEMLAGTWTLNGQPIIFNIKGQLIDGQHRLMALIESEKSIEISVVRGVNLGVETTLDTGKSRTLGDVFIMKGIRNAKLLSRTSKLWLIWETHFEAIVQKRMFTKEIMNVHPQKIYNFYKQNQLALDRACAEFKRNIPIITNTGAAVLSFIFIILEKIDIEKCYAFITSFVSGNIKKDWAYMVTVRDMLLTRKRTSNTRLTEQERISLLFGIWNVIIHKIPPETAEHEMLNIPLELVQNDNIKNHFATS